jgi:hypothetical protein
MRSRYAAVLAVVTLAIATVAPTSRADDPPMPPKGFVSLFNGEDFAGWHGMPHFDPRELAAMTDEAREKQIKEWNDDLAKHWTVKDHVIVNDGNGVYLTTDKEYGDFELLVDFMMFPKGDSGIYLRGNPQVQIWDYTKEGGKWDLGADKGSGGLWNNSPGAPGKDPLVLADKPFGEWNHFRIVMVGSRVTVHLNDKLVVDNAVMENYFDRESPVFARGPIQLQTHGSEIRWKNVYLREIPAEEANKILESHDEGFKSIFDGKTLDGWAGATANYEVVDGAIRCKPNSGGVLYHDTKLQDFQARVEFRLPPGGNNGLAIRYPGEGDAAYSGMTELQVLDNTAEQYKNLDPRQYHGSSYGMVPSKRGFQRPVGEWNTQLVTVKGSTIKVMLNGFPILDADLSKVTEFMADSAHPGKDLKEGFFGFAGHGDPVEFRGIAIKPLD